jgi:hypothetical protein
MIIIILIGSFLPSVNGQNKDIFTVVLSFLKRESDFATISDRSPSLNVLDRI